MPLRVIPLVRDNYYHIFNRSVERVPIFTNKWVNKRAIEALRYYSNTNPPSRLSNFLTWESSRKNSFYENQSSKKLSTIVEVVCYCLMPNHFHLLAKQNTENGISKLLALFQNSFTRYFNTKHNRTGHLFQGQFKAIRIETEEQLIQTSRYIHLNPFSSYVVKNTDQLSNYRWSSLPEYLNPKSFSFCNKSIILSLFPDVSDYKKYVLDEADYQNKLASLNHLVFEDNLLLPEV